MHIGRASPTLSVAVRRAVLAAAILFASALAWAGRLLLGPGPFAAGPASLLAADLVVLAAVAVVGVLVAGSRWAHRLGMAVVAAGAGLGIVLPVDAGWVAALALSAAALALAPALRAAVRRLPAADGPPPSAVALPLLLAVVPAITGAAFPTGLTPLAWTAVAGSAVATAWYAKAWPGAVTAVRVLAPAAVASGAIGAGVPAGLVMVATAVGIALLAWSSGVRLAARPLVTAGRAVSIPPELAPAEVLEAAGLDERGRRRRPG